jgi:tripartite-type tricarboxylate transporter receptor subunit TctC
VLYGNTGFDPLKDFAHIMLVAVSHSVLVVHPTVAANSVTELIALSKQQRLLFGSGSNGTPGHLAGELFKQVTGAEITHVPYKGNPAAVQSVLAGETHMFIAAVPSVLQHVKSGRVRALGLANERRSRFLPDVPTLAEVGARGAEVETFFTLSAPAGTPKTIIDRLHRELERILNLTDVRERLLQNGIEPIGLGADEAVRRIERDSKKWSAIVKRGGIKVD